MMKCALLVTEEMQLTLRSEYAVGDIQVVPLDVLVAW